MTHPFEVRNEFTVDATPDEVWQAITSGPGVDSWLMGRTEIDSANKTSTFAMFGEMSTGQHHGLGTRSPLRDAGGREPGRHVHGLRVADRGA